MINSYKKVSRIYFEKRHGEVSSKSFYGDLVIKIVFKKLQSETPRATMTRREAADREKRLKELDEWRQRKMEEKERKEKENKKLHDSIKKKKMEETRQRERILKMRELEVTGFLI